MFDKDKEIGLIVDRFIGLNTEFILWDARIIREDFPTELGPAVQSQLIVSKMDNPNERYETTSLASAIAAKVREADVTDFPAVVQLNKVASKYGNDALVIQFVKPYKARNYGSPPRTPAPDPAPAQSAQPSDIPF
jgi:hypothetical protein